MRIAVGKTKLFFDVEGASLVPDGPTMRKRPTVVLLHGGPGADHSIFKPVLSPLADCAQVVYLDHRGQGRSDPGDPSEWNLQTWAKDVKDFCDALEIERPIVIGGSFGGFVALRYAIDYPEHPSKLVLMVTAARMNRDAIHEAMALFGGEAQRAAAERYFAEPSEESESAYEKTCSPLYSIRPQDPNVEQRILHRTEVTRHFYAGEGWTFDHREGAACVKCPVLVLSGTRDPITPLCSGAELAHALPQDLVEFVTIENASHDLATDAPEQALQALRRFIME